ncbi:hypothetical protein JANAI62_27710 [Jannaschia pagri]|uniref:DUF2244 domain-containing protein n=1 Tax=Jannaschia pagri TaxID=2829797 RepID=A0ABQ4NP08_9RHOB|nr:MULTISPECIES: DUF2244 domain-containing protein [unclassified Jannaschia]GIT92313.1 hypothetical protein JANAI61_27710 [Jannaschia sp. AI_61]GIT96148.1 hypothetical protein JANAI62_27710 [Jannaschia sp. AI_62]
MPIKVITDHTQGAPASSGAPSSVVLSLELWPHQSLTPGGFVTMIGATFAMLMVPLVGLLGTAVLWGVLPFELLVLGLLWFGLKRSWRDRDILERFEMTTDAVTLTRRDPDGSLRDWEANPYWMRVERHERVAGIEDYLTLEGGPRKVEIGAFLTPEERRQLERQLLNALGRVKS